MGRPRIRGSTTVSYVSSFRNGGQATVMGETQLREMVDRLSVYHDRHADLSEESRAIISEGGGPNTREESRRRGTLAGGRVMCPLRSEVRFGNSVSPFPRGEPSAPTSRSTGSAASGESRTSITARRWVLRRLTPWEKQCCDLALPVGWGADTRKPKSEVLCIRGGARFPPIAGAVFTWVVDNDRALGLEIPDESSTRCRSWTSRRRCRRSGSDTI
jgi:hypothetical protein